MIHYEINSPTCISFSGGRTSAYMLKQFLDANETQENMVVCFANTGKEEEATLRFVDRCSQEWDVPIVWIEHHAEAGKPSETERVRVVGFDTASRNGEPFKLLIEKKQYLPNPVTRFCTVELKIRPMHHYLKSIGWDEYDMATGIRADEQRRVSKIRARGSSSESKKATMILPLADAGVSVKDVFEFWRHQGFDLELPNMNGKTMHGNCDLCFLKGANQIVSLIAEKPSRAIWWAEMEALALASMPSGAVFRSDRPSYAAMLKFTKEQRSLFDGQTESIECFCGD